MKKICIAFLLCCLMGSTAYAVDYGTVTDSTTGRRVDWFNLDGDTTRTYVTQNAWFSDNKSFIVRNESDKRIYKYDVDTHATEPLFAEGIELDNAAVVGPDDRVYAACHSDGNLYVQMPKGTLGSVELTMTLPFKSGYETDEAHTESEGEWYTQNGLSFRLNNVNRYRDVVTLARQRGGQWCRVTVSENRMGSTGQGLWAEYYNYNVSSRASTHMSFTVDNSRISADTRNVIIEFDYFDDSNSECKAQPIELQYLKYNDGGTPVKAVKRMSVSGSNTWKTAKFILTDAQFDKSSALKADGVNYDFRIGKGANRGGLAVRYVKVYTTDFMSLGNKLGGWHPHVSKNGDLSLTHGDNTLIIYEANNQRFATTDVWVKSAHAIINPVYPNLVLYSYEGANAKTTNGRIRLFNRNTMFKDVIFGQYKNSLTDGTTGEAIGHENWSPDGEHIVAVKYREDTNVGKNGIVRMDKYGGNREYINDDYDYWHCDASPDGRWIVADTKIDEDNYTNIVLIDTKTGKSHLVAHQPTGDGDPYEPHASFSRDGQKVTFAYDKRERKWEGLIDGYKTYHTYGVAIVDVSDIVNDGQIAEPTAPTDFQISPFTIGFNKDTGKNEVSASVDNIDGVKRDMTLFAAVYDADGKLISVGKRRYNSANDETLTTDFDGVAEGQTLKCFVWNDENKPIENSVDTIKWLRAAKVSGSEVVLSWQNESDMPVLKYEVYRGDTKIGETPYTVYRDSGLTQNTQYIYYVRPVYSNTFCLGEDGAEISANLDNLNFDGIYSVLGNPVKNYGLTFLENNNLAFDSYTELKYIGGEYCRQARKVLKGETDGQGNTRTGSDYNGMFYFKCDRSAVKADDNKVLIGVRYYDNRDDANLGIKYLNTSGTATEKTIVAKTNTNTWKTATIVLDDAKFIDSNTSIDGYDFRLAGGWGMNISRVWVIPLDENGNMRTNDGLGGQVVGAKAGVKVTTNTGAATLHSSKKQYVEWNTSESKGLTANKTGDTSVWINGNMNDWFKFNVEDGYLYGAGNNMVWVDITYKDSGTSKIYIYYNTSDPTASTDAQKASKAADTVITCTGTEEWKTATVPLIDADFSNKLDSTYDFAIRVDSDGSAVNGVSFKSVKVLGY